jgi:hypothetical protein
MAVRRIGKTFSEEMGEHGEIHAEVRPGDEGTFLGFDGPPGEVVVTFPEAFTFATAQENVEPTTP